MTRKRDKDQGAWFRLQSRYGVSPYVRWKAKLPQRMFPSYPGKASHGMNGYWAESVIISFKNKDAFFLHRGARI